MPAAVEQRQPFAGLFEPWHQPLELGRNELRFEIPGRRATAEADMGTRGLVGPDQHAVGLLAHIAMRPRIAQHRQLALAIDELLQRLGDHVMMQEIGDRHGVAGPRADHVGIGAGRIHHMLAADGAALGDDLPLARRQAADVGGAAAAMDGGAAAAGAGRHGVGDIGRCHMAVGEGDVGRLDPEGLDKGVIGLDLVGAYDLRLVAGEPRQAMDIFEPVDLIVGDGQPDAAAAVPRHRDPGQRLELGIKLGAVDMHLGEIERAVEMRALAGGVPGRSRGQLSLLDQHDVAPSLLHQVIEEADAHDPAAHNDNPRLRLHFEHCSRSLALL